MELMRILFGCGLCYCISAFTFGRLMKRGVDTRIRCWVCSSDVEDCSRVDSVKTKRVFCDPGEDCYAELTERRQGNNGMEVNTTRVDRGCEGNDHLSSEQRGDVIRSFRTSCSTDSCNYWGLTRSYSS